MALALKNEMKLLAKHSAVYSLGNFMQRVVALLLLPVYTRFLTPYDYGIKELVGLSADVIGILMAATISGAFFRFYFKYDSNADRNEVISTSILAISVVGLVFLLPLLLFSKTIAGTILNDANLYHYFIIAFVSLWFQSINHISYNLLKARKQSIKFISLSFAKMILAISLNIYFICFIKIGVIGILISNLITAIAMSIIVSFPLLIEIGIHLSKSKLVEMIRFGIPLVPAQFGAFVVHLSDRFFLKEYCSIADVGIYSLGYRFGTLPGTFISDPFNQIFAPRRLEVYKESGSEYIFGRIFTYFLFLILFVGLMVSVLSKDIIIIIADEKFWSAYKIIPLIVVSSILFSFHYHFDIGLIIAQKTKYFAYINLSNALVVMVLNFILIPKFGIFGAAYATLIAFFYKIVLTYYFSSRYYKIYFEFIRILKILVCALLIFTGTLFISADSIYLDFLLKLLAILLYPFILYLMRLYSDDELSKARQFIVKWIERLRKSKRARQAG